MLAYTGLRERAEFSTLERSRLWASIKSMAGNRPFIILLIATTLAIMAINIPTVLIRFLAKYWYHDENAAARWLIWYFAGWVFSYPFWCRITVRFEKKPAFVVSMVCDPSGSLLFLLMTPHRI